MPARPPKVPFLGWERYVFLFLGEKNCACGHGLRGTMYLSRGLLQNSSKVSTCLRSILSWAKKGLDMAWKWIRISLESRMGCPDGSGARTKSYSPCLKLHASVSHFFLY
jgi:hypothetical protein